MKTTCTEISIEDGRLQLSVLQEKYLELKELGWYVETITIQKNTFPIYAFTTTTKSLPAKSLWIIGGIHGEEPAGPNAFAKEIETINQISKEDIPVVFLPLLNPFGYSKDWRYEDQRRNFHLGHSVSDFDSALLNEKSSGPRNDINLIETAQNIQNWVIRKSSIYLPELVIDHHEDKVPEKFPKGDPRNISSCYVYAAGSPEISLTIAQNINKIFQESGLPVVTNGKTRFGEKIKKGVVKNGPDGSIDEFLSTDHYFDQQSKTIKSKHAAKASIVVETTIPFDNSLALEKRIVAHRKIINSYLGFWQMLQNSNQSLKSIKSNE